MGHNVIDPSNNWPVYVIFTVWYGFSDISYQQIEILLLAPIIIAICFSRLRN